MRTREVPVKRKYVAASAIFALRAFSAGISGDVRQQITLRVVNEDGISWQIVSNAENEAGFILGKAGVRVEWLNCADGFVDWAREERCSQVPGPRDFDIRIVVRQPRERHASALGLAVLPEGAAEGRPYAVIYYPVAEVMAQMSMADAFQVVGAAIAHEVGHLLLGANHSRTGLMRAKWTGAELERISVRSLRFSSDESTGLRRAIAALDHPKLAVAAVH